MESILAQIGNVSIPRIRRSKYSFQIYIIKLSLWKHSLNNRSNNRLKFARLVKGFARKI